VEATIDANVLFAEYIDVATIALDRAQVVKMILSSDRALFGGLDVHRRASPQDGSPGAQHQLEQATPGEVDQHFMVPQSLAALHQPEIPYQAVMAAAHPSQTAVLEASHGWRECTADRFRQILTTSNRQDHVTLLAAYAVGNGPRSSRPAAHESKTSGRALPEVWEA
jgi:hypothetical protein